jgi:hypothetical protein
MEWACILAYITGTVDQELLLRNEYLAAENRILKAQLQGRLRLSDAERMTLGEVGHRLGRKALSEAASAAMPDTILKWYRTLAQRNSMDRPLVEPRAGRQSAPRGLDGPKTAAATAPRIFDALASSRSFAFPATNVLQRVSPVRSPPSRAVG